MLVPLTDFMDYRAPDELWVSFIVRGTKLSRCLLLLSRFSQKKIREKHPLLFKEKIREKLLLLSLFLNPTEHPSPTTGGFPRKGEPGGLRARRGEEGAVLGRGRARGAAAASCCCLATLQLLGCTGASAGAAAVTARSDHGPASVPAAAEPGRSLPRPDQQRSSVTPQPGMLESSRSLWISPGGQCLPPAPELPSHHGSESEAE